MAQVKVQTSAPLAGPGLPPGVPPTAMASPGPLGLQPSVNGTGSAPTPACPAPAGGFGEAPGSAISPGSAERFSSGKLIFGVLPLILTHTTSVFYFGVTVAQVYCVLHLSHTLIFLKPCRPFSTRRILLLQTVKQNVIKDLDFGS